MLNIVLFGPPGAGKGTQSKKIIEKYRLVHLSTGDILRAEVAAGTELGQEAKKLMDQGMLVPDEVVIGMINNKLDDNKGANGFIFDGFPRTVEQAVALDGLLDSKQTAISGMIALEVEEQELRERLAKRAMEQNRPDDAKQEVISKRIEEYRTKTAPVAGYYKKQGKFTSVDGVGDIDGIFEDLCKVIDNYRS